MKLDKFCEFYHLGEVLSTENILGGRMHKMFKVKTNKGVYAIKVLNPEVMKRKGAYQNFIQSERISSLAKASGISVSNALLIQGDFIHLFEDNYYMVFEYVDGKTLSDQEITVNHCRKIGKLLAKIHQLEYSNLDLKDNFVEYSRLYPWEEYTKNVNFQNMTYQELFLKNYRKYNSLLKRANERYNESNKTLTVCHRDLDPKNVLWNEENPIIIDWESAGLMNPYRELIETALSWSGFSSNHFDEQKFSSIISEYTKYRKLEHQRYSIICGNLVGRFGWLKYNLERSLGIISKDLEEQKLAEEEVSKTILEINRYQQLIGPMYQIICRITKKEIDQYNSIVERLIENQPLLKGQNYKKLNAGFSNTCYQVGNYIVRICTNVENEVNFEKEMEFYSKNKENPYIPKCYITDQSKTIIPYEYEIIEYIEGKTLYEIWYQLSEKERKNLIMKLVDTIKCIHTIKVEPYDFKEYLKEEFRKVLKENRMEKELLQKLLVMCDQYFEENHFGLIHGDLHFDNLIYRDDKIYIIDFEKVWIAPIDYEFRIFNRCRFTPWLWASEQTDMLTVENDYQELLPDLIETYEELGRINYLWERLKMYQILEELKKYKKSKNIEIFDKVKKEIGQLNI